MTGNKIAILWTVLTAAGSGLAWRSWDQTQTKLEAVELTLVDTRIQAAKIQVQYEEILRRLERIERAVDKVRP